MINGSRLDSISKGDSQTSELKEIRSTEKEKISSNEVISKPFTLSYIPEQ